MVHVWIEGGVLSGQFLNRINMQKNIWVGFRRVSQNKTYGIQISQDTTCGTQTIQDMTYK